MRLTEKLWEQYKKASFSQIPCGYLTKFALSFSASSLQKYIFPQLFKNKFYMWYPFTCRYLNVYCPAPQKRSYWNFMLSQYILYSKENPDWYVFSFVSWLSFNLITQSFFVFRDIDIVEENGPIWACVIFLMIIIMIGRNVIDVMLYSSQCIRWGGMQCWYILLLKFLALVGWLLWCQVSSLYSY